MYIYMYIYIYILKHNSNGHVKNQYDQQISSEATQFYQQNIGLISNKACNHFIWRDFENDKIRWRFPDIP